MLSLPKHLSYLIDFFLRGNERKGKKILQYSSKIQVHIVGTSDETKQNYFTSSETPTRRIDIYVSCRKFRRKETKQVKTFGKSDDLNLYLNIKTSTIAEVFVIMVRKI
ncbi:hypothetical protein [Chryseobacterium sp. MMS23-Vi53]|uniref:hypothetical protein n=1 Tax=Chryseobacterium sp. MMS23-Vi53 TaxID=3386644 RepID=UPI0039E9A74E